MTRRQNLLLAAAAAATATVSTFIGLPAIIFEGNQESFVWPLANLVLSYWPYMLITCAVLIVPAVILPPKVGALWSAATVVAAAYLWAHGVFQSHEFGSVDGVNFNPTVPFGEATVEVALIVVLVSLIGFFAYTRPVAARLIILLPFASMLIQGVPTLLAKPLAPVVTKLSVEDIGSLSPNANVIVVLLDAMQSDVFEKLVNENSDLKESFSGFTLFADTLGAASTTYLSLPAIHASATYSRQPLRQYFISAVRDHSVLTEVVAAGYQGFLVNAIQGVCPADLVCTSTRKAMIGATGEMEAEARTLLDAVLFRLAPLGLKAAVYNKGNWVFQALIKDDRFSNAAVQGNEFMKEVATAIKADAGKPQLRFFHLPNTHPPFVLNRDCAYSGGELTWNRENIEQQVSCALKSLKLVFDQMKSEGVYDQSHIFVISDHGVGLETTRSDSDINLPSMLRLMGQANPTFAVKPAHSAGPIKIDNRQAHIGDLAATLCDLLQTCKSEVGVSAFASEESRSRIFNQYQWRHEYWLAETIPGLSQFTVTGPLGNSASWLPDDAALLQLDVPYNFSTTGSTQPVMGWHDSEDWGIWSGSKTSSLLFRLPEKLPAETSIKLSAIGFVAAGHEELTVKVKANNHEIGVVQFTLSNAAQEIELPVPRSALFADKGFIRFTFEQNGITSPENLGLSADSRTLGIGLKSLTLKSGDSPQPVQ